MHKQGKQYNPEVLLIKAQCRSVHFTNICPGTWTPKFCQYLHHLWNYCSPISTVTPNCQRESLPVVNPHGATTGLQFIMKQKCYWRQNWCLFPSPHLKGTHFPEIKMLQRIVEFFLWDSIILGRLYFFWILIHCECFLKSFFKNNSNNWNSISPWKELSIYLGCSLCMTVHCRIVKIERYFFFLSWKGSSLV